MMNHKNYLKWQKGQVALIVLLVSAVVMTLGLSLSRKTVVETKIDTDEELLRQAFDAAESGLDYYMTTGDESFKTEGVGTSIEADVVANNIGGSNRIDYDEFTLAGQATTYWLVEHLANGNIGTNYYQGTRLNVCVDSAFAGSLKIDYYYNIGVRYNVNRLIHNFGSAPNVVNNVTGLTTDTCSGGRKGVRVPLRSLGGSGRQLLLAVTPIFYGTRISIEGTSNFPLQGIDLVSTGYVGRDSSQGISGVSRIVRVSNRYRLPSFMLEAIASGGNVTSN